jgi:hypothetical protein
MSNTKNLGLQLVFGMVGVLSGSWLLASNHAFASSQKAFFNCEATQTEFQTPAKALHADQTRNEIFSEEAAKSYNQDPQSLIVEDFYILKNTLIPDSKHVQLSTGCEILKQELQAQFLDSTHETAGYRAFRVQIRHFNSKQEVAYYVAAKGGQKYSVYRFEF